MKKTAPQAEKKSKSRDRLIQATAQILLAHGFSVEPNSRGQRMEVPGDSGTTYFPDLVAGKGPWHLVVEARTRGQRGLGDLLDKRSVQLMVAMISDLEHTLMRPHGMLVSPHGIEPTAQKVAEHFGIMVGVLPFTVVDKILELDPHSRREDIFNIAKGLDLAF